MNRTGCFPLIQDPSPFPEWIHCFLWCTMIQASFIIWPGSSQHNCFYLLFTNDSKATCITLPVCNKGNAPLITSKSSGVFFGRKKVANYVALSSTLPWRESVGWFCGNKLFNYSGLEQCVQCMLLEHNLSVRSFHNYWFQDIDWKLLTQYPDIYSFWLVSSFYM